MESSKDKKKNIIIICAVLLIIIFIVMFSVISDNKTYIVTFDDGYSTNEVEVKKNNTVEEPSDPEKDGYIFIGWYKDGIEFDFSTKIDKNVTLTAKYEKDSGSKKITTTSKATTTTTTTETTTTSKTTTKNKTVKNNTTTKYIAPATTTTKYVAPATTTTTTTKKVVTYSYKIVDVPGSVSGQAKLYVVNNDTGAYVDGYVSVTYENGNTNNELHVPVSGFQYIKTTIISISNPRGN